MYVDIILFGSWRVEQILYFKRNHIQSNISTLEYRQHISNDGKKENEQHYSKMVREQ